MATCVYTWLQYAIATRTGIYTTAYRLTLMPESAFCGCSTTGTDAVVCALHADMSWPDFADWMTFLLYLPE